MNNIASHLKQVVEDAAQRLRSIPEEGTLQTTVENPWSARQVLGHLIDSAANNHQRFVRAQFMDDLVFPGYEQEKWILAQHYNDEAWPTSSKTSHLKCLRNRACLTTWIRSPGKQSARISQ